LNSYGNVILWNYHYPVGDYLFRPVKRLEMKEIYTLGYVGSLLPKKGLGFLLKALSKLPKFRLKVIGGNRDQVRAAKDLVYRLRLWERVEFVGFTPQKAIPEFLSDVDILVAPFLESQRTIPLKVYEYMALGLPVISSDIEAVRVVAGDHFFYFKPGVIEDFVSTLKEVVDFPNRSLQKVMEMRRYGENFRWYRVIRKILRDLEEV
jgi:glycosyltransferase involved in cell wall biosynthesis